MLFLKTTFSSKSNIYIFDKDYKSYNITEELLNKVGDNLENFKYTFSKDNDCLIMINKNNINIYNIIEPNQKERVIRHTLKYFIRKEKDNNVTNKFSTNNIFDSNLMQLIYDFI